MIAKRIKNKVEKKKKVRATRSRKRKNDDSPEDLYWIAIGASAGGLEALRDLISKIPSRPSKKLTFVIAQHLSPTHQSMLVQLLGRETKLSVIELVDMTRPEPDTIYITPPNKDVCVQDGLLRLTPPISELSPKPSIDHFFSSLAEHAGDHVVGVVLSGTGSDGAHGIRAIRAAGGITIAQDPSSAKYDTMPRRAIETNCVDLVLEPRSIIGEILNHIQAPGELKLLKNEDTAKGGIQELLHLLKLRCGVDFSNYKTGTLFRRINRRMVAQNAANLQAYLECVDKDPKELDALFRDVMITVTSFFRDPESFAVLNGAIKRLLERKNLDEPIRVWIPGCATGEEAYSVAILLAEICGNTEKLEQKYKVQIFATDIDIEALAYARKGVYPQAALTNLSKVLREKYFRHRDHAYEIVKSVRDMVVFSRHNVFDDPPFLRLDLISCRNLLIYFNTKLQQSVFSIFHYALRQEGILFLGKSESLGQSADLFIQSDAKNKLFRRRIVAPPNFHRQGTNSVFKKPAVQVSGVVANKGSHEFSDALIQSLSPDSLLIDENMEVLRVYGDVRAYTQLSPGGASTNLMSLARAEVRQELRALIYKILREDLNSTVLPKRLMTEGELHEVKILVRPLRLKSSNERLLLVSFEKVKQVKAAGKESRSNGRIDPLLAEMEQELSATKEHLQTVIEELETSNEELQSTNEEMQSSNEELQSSNEELETANEELQSTNEELLTVNEELQVKSAELVATNEDLNNIKDSIDYPLVVVDRQLNLKRFNTAAYKIFDLNEDSSSGSILALSSKIEIPNLRESVQNVVATGDPHTQQLDSGAVCYVLRVIPFRDTTKKIEGAVVTFVDNTIERKALQSLRASEQRFQLAVQGSSCGIWEWNMISDEMYWSPQLLAILGISSKETMYKFRDFEKRIHPDDLSDVTAVLDAHIQREFDFILEFRLRKNSGEYIWVDTRGQVKRGEDRKPLCMAGSIYDISQRREAVKQLVQSNQALERFAYVCCHDLKEPARLVENYTDLFIEKYGANLDEKGARYLQRIRESGQRMQLMIKDVLAYSQLEHKEVELTQIDCGQEVQKVLENLKLCIEESGAKIVVSDLPSISGDRMQIFQVFQNLISNAIKFARGKGPEVKVSAEEKFDHWQFAIQDNGIGINPEYSTKIFEVFQRLNTHEDFPGTGIGLSICQKVLRKHRGNIWVKSVLGEGSTFYFTIPKKLALRRNGGVENESANR